MLILMIAVMIAAREHEKRILSRRVTVWRAGSLYRVNL